VAFGTRTSHCRHTDVIDDRKLKVRIVWEWIGLQRLDVLIKFHMNPTTITKIAVGPDTQTLCFLSAVPTSTRQKNVVCNSGCGPRELSEQINQLHCSIEMSIGNHPWFTWSEQSGKPFLSLRHDTEVLYFSPLLRCQQDGAASISSSLSNYGSRNASLQIHKPPKPSPGTRQTFPSHHVHGSPENFNFLPHIYLIFVASWETNILQLHSYRKTSKYRD
jgi:hypothetical protein